MKTIRNTFDKHPLLNTVASITVFILIWHLYVTLVQVPHFMLPAPLSVLKELVHQFSGSSIWLHIGITLYEVLVGFILGVIVGAIIAYAIYKSETLSDYVKPILIFLQVAPKIALVPLFVVWFGLGLTSKIIVVFSMVVFPIIIGIESALRQIPSSYYDLLHVVQSPKSKTIVDLEIPYILPEVFASLKIAIVQAIIGATVAEWMAGQYGLGYIQSFASSTFNTPLLIAGIVVTIILGVILYQIIEILERKYIFWK